MPTLKAMWSPKGRQVMMPTPAQPKKRYGIGAVDYHTGETVVLIRRGKRRREIAELLEALLWKSTRREESMWPGTTQTLTKTSRLRRFYAERRAEWFCSSCRPTALG